MVAVLDGGGGMSGETTIARSTRRRRNCNTATIFGDVRGLWVLCCDGDARNERLSNHHRDKTVSVTQFLVFKIRLGHRSQPGMEKLWRLWNDGFRTPDFSRCAPVASTVLAQLTLIL